MYKRDYHPDENLIFETEHYKFPVSKSTTEDPDLARTVKIDEALYDEAKVRLNEDTKLNKKLMMITPSMTPRIKLSNVIFLRSIRFCLSYAYA